MLPESTANIPLMFECPWAYDWITASSFGCAAPVATVSTLSFDPIESFAPSMRGWMLSDPGVAMNSAMSLPAGTRLEDPLAHLLPGDEQVLADVRQPRVAGRVRVIGEDRDVLAERVLGRAVERLRVHKRDGDAVDAGAMALLNALTISVMLLVFDPSTDTSSRAACRRQRRRTAWG